MGLQIARTPQGLPSHVLAPDKHINRGLLVGPHACFKTGKLQ